MRTAFHAILLASLLLVGCGPRIKADVDAYSRPGFQQAGRTYTYTLAPGPGMTGIAEADSQMVEGRLKAALAGHGYKEAASPEEAELEIVYAWRVEGPHRVATSTPYYPRSRMGYNSGFSFIRGFGMFGGSHATPMTLVYVRTFTVDAIERLAPRTPLVDATTSATLVTTPSTAAPSGAASPAATPSTPASPAAAPSGAASSGATPKPLQDTHPLPDYTKPPYAPPLPDPSLPAVGSGSPFGPSRSATAWQVTVSSANTTSDIRPILPHLLAAALRWLGTTASIPVTVDEDYNVTPRGF